MAWELRFEETSLFTSVFLAKGGGGCVCIRPSSCFGLRPTSLLSPLDASI